MIYKHIPKKWKLLLIAFLYNGLHKSDLTKGHDGSETQALLPVPADITVLLISFLQMRKTKVQDGMESRS